MTVKVYDRNDDSWLYESATQAVSNEGHLTIYNEDGTVAGGFNAASWTHHVVGKGAERKITVAVPVARGVTVDPHAVASDAIRRECDTRGRLLVSGVEYVGATDADDFYTIHTYEATTI